MRLRSASEASTAVRSSLSRDCASRRSRRLSHQASGAMSRVSTAVPTIVTGPKDRFSSDWRWLTSARET